MMSSWHRGFNLIEAAIVLGVVGLIIGGIWVAAAAVSERMKQSRFQQQMLELRSNIRQRFPDSLGVTPYVFFGSVSNLALGRIGKEAWVGVIPADMVSGSDLPVAPWGNDVAVRLIDASSAPALSISISGMSTAACANIGPRLYSYLKNDLIDQGVGAIVHTGALELDVSNASTAPANCKTEFDSEGAVDISFTVSR